MAIGGALCILALQAGRPDAYAQGANAISKGLEYARAAGLVSQPADMTIAKMNHTGYRKLIEPDGELSQSEMQTDRAVWVLKIKGEVVLNLPGAVGDRYDNLTVVIDARTGELVEITARAPGHEVEWQGEHVTVADGVRFPLGDSSSESLAPSVPTATPLLEP
jgi:hypothetical protein